MFLLLLLISLAVLGLIIFYCTKETSNSTSFSSSSSFYFIDKKHFEHATINSHYDKNEDNRPPEPIKLPDQAYQPSLQNWEEVISEGNRLIQKAISLDKSIKNELNTLQQLSNQNLTSRMIYQHYIKLNSISSNILGNYKQYEQLGLPAASLIDRIKIMSTNASKSNTNIPQKIEEINRNLNDILDIYLIIPWDIRRCNNIIHSTKQAINRLKNIFPNIDKS